MLAEAESTNPKKRKIMSDLLGAVRNARSLIDKSSEEVRRVLRVQQAKKTLCGMLIFWSSLHALPMLQHEYLHICCTCRFKECAQYLHMQWHIISVQKQDSKSRCNVLDWPRAESADPLEIRGDWGRRAMGLRLEALRSEDRGPWTTPEGGTAERRHGSDGRRASTGTSRNSCRTNELGCAPQNNRRSADWSKCEGSDSVFRRRPLRS